MAAVLSTSSLYGVNPSKTRDLVSVRSGALVKTPRVAIQTKSNRSRTRSNFSVRAGYSYHRGGDFVAGFIVGGALCGTLAYVFAPELRRAILNEDEHGFIRPRKPPYMYYAEMEEDALEKTRKNLSEKIGQLNSAIDGVYSRLKGGNNMLVKPDKNDYEDVAP